jgi:hypothetical protein
MGLLIALYSIFRLGLNGVLLDLKVPGYSKVSAVLGVAIDIRLQLFSVNQGRLQSELSLQSPRGLNCLLMALCHYRDFLKIRYPKTHLQSTLKLYVAPS